MKAKIIIGAVVIIGGLVLGTVNFLESNVEYMDFATAERSGKKAQVTGTWVKEMETRFDSQTTQFTFYMKDEKDRIIKVVLEGAQPNNFEIATSVVVKGKFMDDHFHASDVLTKCPSKYEGDAETMKKTL